ncbi:MAG: lysyl endopeptidase, partial [Bacteroidota bacterium]|nr:lysyl endopeptidase [Bacteroidota bacterium]
MKQSTVIFFFLFNLAFPLFGQISYGGIPESFKYNLKSAVTLIDLPQVDTLALIREDNEIKTNRQKPFRFAKTFTVNYNTVNSGAWRTLANGDKIWQIELRSKGAHSLNVIFNDFELPEGAKVFVYDEKRTQILGAFTEKNNSDSHILPVSPIRGDDLVVEYF